ncbi:JAB domain-containing protein [Ruminococcus sp.]
MAEDTKLRREQLLKKYEEKGFDGLTEHERLELLFTYSRCTEPAALAAELLGEYGSINALANADPALLMKDGRINESTAVLLRLIPSVSRSLYMERFAVKTIKDAESAKKYFSGHFIGAVGEKLIITAVSKKMRVISSKVLAYGTNTKAAASYKDIADFVVRTDCTIFFTAHNHPNGSSMPSDSDILFTKNVIASMTMLGAVLADHIIIGASDATSFRELGILREMSDKNAEGYHV